MLLACTVLIGVAVCVWAGAIGTRSWLVASTEPDQKLEYREDVMKPNLTRVFKEGNSGLFSYCVNGYTVHKKTLVVNEYSEFVKKFFSSISMGR